MITYWPIHFFNFIYCRILRDQNQLQYNDISLTFIRNVTHVIENKYPSTNVILEINSSSCRLAGELLCSHLIKMLFAFYNVNPVLPSEQTNINQTTSSIRIFVKLVKSTLKKKI